jgi:hypothetical protein
MSEELKSRSGARSLLAWEGWRLAMPREWQPLKLSGSHEKGFVIVGDSQVAIFQLKWLRPGGRGGCRGEAWVAGRLKQLGAAPEAHPPAAARFTACGWVNGLQKEEGKRTTYWYGVAEGAGLLLEFVVNGVLPDGLLRIAVREVLPSLAATDRDAETMWAMYDMSFASPPGYRLARRQLRSGDVALEFRRGGRETLLLRQVYPADLALSRRPYERWLALYPFTEHRRLRRSSVRSDPWSDAGRARLRGVRRRAWKRLAAPLGWCAPRRSTALAVTDESSNRLLIAEHMSADEPDESLCAEAVAAMNRDARVA